MRHGEVRGLDAGCILRRVGVMPSTLGFMPPRRHTRRNRKGEEFEFVDRRVTGWQLIDFLERMGG